MIPSDQFKPRCLTGQCLGHSNKGYILPCCYVDSYFDNKGNKDNDKLNALFDPSIKISNNDHIHDITMSDIWIDFYTMLQDESQEKPRLCVMVCDPKSRQAEMVSHNKINPVHGDRRYASNISHTLKFNQTGRKQEAKVIYRESDDQDKA